MTKNFDSKLKKIEATIPKKQRTTVTTTTTEFTGRFDIIKSVPTYPSDKKTFGKKKKFDVLKVTSGHF